MRSNRLETLPATRRPLVQVPVREANQLRFQVLIINITEPVDCPNSPYSLNLVRDVLDGTP